MEEYAETNSVPIIGPLVGRLLYNLAKISQSRKVLEIGTAIGYSGIWLARAVAPLKGSLTTIDMNPERVKIAKKNIAEAGLDRAVKVIEGSALDILPTLKESYDMIFLDSDKDEIGRASCGKSVLPCVDLGGRRIIKKKKKNKTYRKHNKKTGTNTKHKKITQP